MMPPENRDKATLTRQIFKNSSIVLFGQALSLLANLAVTVMMARYLGDAGFGVFSYGLVFASFFALIADFGMKPIIVRELARDHWQPEAFLGAAVVMRFVLAVLAIVATVVASIIAGYNGQYLTVIGLLSLNIVFSSKLSTFRVTFETPFNADIDMFWPMVLRFLDSILAAILIFLCVRFSASLEMVVAAFVLSSAPGMLINVILAFRKRPWIWQLDWEIVQYLLKESLPICLYTILVTFLAGIDVFMLKALSGEEAVGLYSAAKRLTTPMQFIPHAIVISLFPIFSRSHVKADSGVERAFQLGFKLILLLGLAFAMTTALMSQKIVDLLYTAEFSTSAQPLALLMWSIVFMFLNFYFIEILTSANLQKASFYVAAVMLLLNVPANFLLIPNYGIIGAAQARLLAYAVGSAMLVYFVQKKYRFPEVGFWVRMAFVAVIFMAIGHLLLKSVPVVAALVVSVLLFSVLVLASGVFRPDERATFLAIFRKKSGE